MKPRGGLDRLGTWSQHPLAVGAEQGDIRTARTTSTTGTTGTTTQTVTPPRVGKCSRFSRGLRGLVFYLVCLGGLHGEVRWTSRTMTEVETRRPDVTTVVRTTNDNDLTLEGDMGTNHELSAPPAVTSERAASHQRACGA